MINHFFFFLFIVSLTVTSFHVVEDHHLVPLYPHDWMNDHADLTQFMWVKKWNKLLVKTCPMAGYYIIAKIHHSLLIWVGCIIFSQLITLSQSVAQEDIQKETGTLHCWKWETMQKKLTSHSIWSSSKWWN